MKADKNGLNPVMDTCWWCGDDTGDIMLLQNNADKYTDKHGNLPMHIVFSMGPCKKCLGHMEKGCMLVAVTKEGPYTKLNPPVRTGPMAVVRDSAIEGIFQDNEEMRDQVLKQRACCVPDALWDVIGLPRADFDLTEEQDDTET